MPFIEPSLRHLAEVLSLIPQAAYACDADGLLTTFNAQAVELWGREPRLHDPTDRYCGSHLMYSSDGEPVAKEACWMALALQQNESFKERQIVFERPDGTRRLALAHAHPLRGETGRVVGGLNVLIDITESAQRGAHGDRTAELEAEVRRLRSELNRSGGLRGCLPMCASCKKIRDKAGSWQQIETFLTIHTAAELTHGVCPECAVREYGFVPRLKR